MRKLSNLLAVTSILIIVYALLAKFSDLLGIRWGFVRIAPHSALIAATFIIFIAVILKISGRKGLADRDFKDIKILTGLLSIIAIGLISVFLMAVTFFKLSEKEVIKRFHILYNDKFPPVAFLGVASTQFPTDNWIMQEIITEVKPDFIIETGTGTGGTTLFYATVLEKVNENGKILTMDIESMIDEASKFKVFRDRVEFFKDSSVSPQLVEAITERVKGRKVLVTLDALHTKEHVLKELELYSPLVSLNSYVVVQDTHYNGHPIKPHFGPGPWEAMEEFLKTNKDFVIDHSKEKYLLTQAPSGFLKRVRQSE